MQEKLPQLIISGMIIIGFGILILIYMLVDMGEKNIEVLKQLMQSAGTAFILVIGYWFGPKQ